jgi:hypothetical protein
MCPREKRLATGTLPARLQRIVAQFQTKQALGQSTRKLLFSNPRRSNEQIGLRQSSSSNRTAKHLALVCMTKKRRPN